MHDWRHMHDRVWYLSVPKSFFDDAITAGPFEYMVAVGFSFEYVLTNLLFVPFISGAAYNGDMGAMTFGFSAQSDEARHMTLGLEAIKFMLEQDPDNLPIVQRWIDKWTWRGTRVLGLVAAMMDYMLPKRVMSWREAWEIYVEQNGGALFKDLARYGIKPPKCFVQASIEKDHLSHQIWSGLYNYGAATGLHTWMPTEKELDWLSEKYPDTFDTYYRPRYEYWIEQQKAGNRFYTKTLPQLCQVCQLPTMFTEPDDPSKLCLRETSFEGEKYHFCSDHCQEIFEHEPEKYIQAWMPTHQVYQGNCFNPGVDPTAPGFDPLSAVLDYYNLNQGHDNLDFEGSEDQKNFQAWRDLATSN
jgi:phenol hydroxylase P3 protein